MAGGLHVSDREEEVEAVRLTLPTPRGAAYSEYMSKKMEKKHKHAYTLKRYIHTTLLGAGGLPGAVGTACCVHSHNAIQVGCIKKTSNDK